MPSDITYFDSVGHDRYHVVAKCKVDKWTPILGDPGAVNFHHEHFIVPANCPLGLRGWWTPFLASKPPNYVLLPAKSLAFSIDTAGIEFKLLRR